MLSLGLDEPDFATERLLVDALQVSSHSPARQRRLLPKLLGAIYEYMRSVSPAPRRRRLTPPGRRV